MATPYIIYCWLLANLRKSSQTCFYGSGIDFAVIMQKSDAFFSTHSTLAANCSGDEPEYLSCASAATASFSAMAALVWSYYGTATPKSDILQKFTNNSYVIASGTSISNDYGYGFINVNNAMY